MTSSSSKINIDHLSICVLGYTLPEYIHKRHPLYEIGERYFDAFISTMDARLGKDTSADWAQVDFEFQSMYSRMDKRHKRLDQLSNNLHQIEGG